MKLLNCIKLSSRCSSDVEPTVAVKIAECLEIAQTRHASTVHINVIDRDVLAAARSAENIIVPAFLCRSTSDVPDDDVRDADTRSRVAGWAAIEVVLLDIDTVDGDVLDAYVFEKNVVDVASGVLVGFDAGAVLGVQDNRVAEYHVGHVVVRLATH